MSIVADGFRLPQKNGMFGKGVYFASTPLKSMQYARKLSLNGDGVVLLCDVALGNARTLYSANAALSPETDLDWNLSYLMRMLGRKSYDSVQASDGPDGAVRVPEYVVYKLPQALPRYVLLLKETL